MDKVYFIAITAIITGIIIYGIIVIINRIANKKKKKEAENILSEVLEKVKAEFGDIIKEDIKGIKIENYVTGDPAQQFKLIESEILDTAFNKANRMIDNLLNEKFPDGKSSVYDLILKLITHEEVEDLVREVLSDNEIKDMITDIYNNCFGDEISNIEIKDKELQKELSQYDDISAIKDETAEQHDQTIEEYAKAHFQEKVDEVNEIYDELENTIPNTVPVRDLRELKVLSYENEEINPPVDNPEEIFDDTCEIVGYINEEEEN